MKKLTWSVLGASALVAATVAAAPQPKPAQSAPVAPEAHAAMLREAALKSNVAYAWVSELTARGPRPPGSAAERAAAEWAAARLKSMGFDSAVVESFPYHPWVRGAHDSIESTAPFPQKLVGVALGGSTAGEVEAEAVLFDSWQSFLDGPVDLAGKIVVVTQPMPRDSDGGGYTSMSSPIRWQGPTAAQKRGAVGFVMRSLGTSSHRFAHAGGTDWSGGTGIPAMAISAPDALQLERIAAIHARREAGPLRLKMVSGATFPGVGTSVNVIAEIKGSVHPEEIVVVGGHLDSWDLGTGATDDAVGHAIALAAAKNLLDHGRRPRRTIRLVLWGSEEMSQPPGFDGGSGNYARMHAAEAPRTVVAMESDFGAGRVYAAAVPATEDAAFKRKLAALLQPLAVAIQREPAESGDSDTEALFDLGVPCLSLLHDGYDQFDSHHTADDILERVDADDLDQVVAAWSATLWLVADTDITFKRPEAKRPE